MPSDFKHNPHPRRAFLTTTLLGVAGGLPSVAAPADQAKSAALRPPTMNLKALNPPDAPAADVGYTPGILAEGQRWVFISGQGPRDYSADMETQFRQTF